MDSDGKLLLNMRESRKFCQRGSNFDNIFLFYFFLIVYEGDMIQMQI